MSNQGNPLADLGVSRETIERLEQFVELLKKWNPAINLVSNGTLGDVWSRHIIDSAQLYRLAGPTVGRWVDLGSGGGFPGLVIACIAAELNPGMDVVLVESDLRKATFLRQAARQLGLATRVVAERVENLPPLAADIVSARALAPLATLCALSVAHLFQNGTALFPKGTNFRSEVEQAAQDWRFDLEVIPSVTEPSAAILKLKGLVHV